jgi:hypothetical protein
MDKEIINRKGNSQDNKSTQHYHLVPEKGTEIELTGLQIRVKDGKKVLEAEVTEDNDNLSPALKPRQEVSHETKQIEIREIIGNLDFGFENYSFTEKQRRSIIKILKPMHFGLDEREVNKFKDIMGFQINLCWNGDKNNLGVNKKGLKKMIEEFHDGYPDRPRRLINSKTRTIAKFLLPLMFVGALAGYKIIPRFLAPSAPVNVENLVEKKYEQYAESIAIAKEQKKPARALLVGGAAEANGNPSMNVDPEGHYRLAQWLAAAFALEGGLTNKEIEFLEYNPKNIVITKTKAYEDFLKRNSGDNDLLRIMNLALEELIIDGPSTTTKIISGLEKLHGERAFVGFFGVDNNKFIAPGGKLDSTKVEEVINLAGGLENSIIMGIGQNGSAYISPLCIENSLNISSQSRSGSSVIKDSRIVESLINSYFKYPEQSILNVLNNVLVEDKTVYGAFVDEEEIKYLGTRDRGINFSNHTMFEGGIISTMIGLNVKITGNGKVYAKDSDIIIPINPDTKLPYQLNFLYDTFDDFFGVKKE